MHSACRSAFQRGRHAGVGCPHTAQTHSAPESRSSEQAAGAQLPAFFQVPPGSPRAGSQQAPAGAPGSAAAFSDVGEKTSRNRTSVGCMRITSDFSQPWYMLSTATKRFSVIAPGQGSLTSALGSTETAQRDIGLTILPEQNNPTDAPARPTRVCRPTIRLLRDSTRAGRHFVAFAPSDDKACLDQLILNAAGRGSHLIREIREAGQ